VTEKCDLKDLIVSCHWDLNSAKKNDKITY
jgi:hypothetical protein